MLANRMARELKMLATDPPPGVAAWPVGDSVTELKAQVRVSWEGGAHMRQTCARGGGGHSARRLYRGRVTSYRVYQGGRKKPASEALPGRENVRASASACCSHFFRALSLSTSSRRSPSIPRPSPSLTLTSLQGPHGTVYERGVFTLAITIPPRYPLEPPAVSFTTPIHHPNIDVAGRICLDTLALPPKGAWRPALNLSGVLASIRALLASPNGDDGLVAEVAHQFRHDRAGFDAAARAWTARHAVAGWGGAGEGVVPGAAGVGDEEEKEAGQAAAAGPASAPPQPAGGEENAAPAPAPSAGKADPHPPQPRPSRLQLGGTKRPLPDQE